MTTRLHLFSLAATTAVRKGCFPDDETLDERGVRETLACGLTEWLPADARLLCAPSALALATAALLPRPAQVEVALADMDYGRWHGQSLGDVASAEPDALAAWLQHPDAPAGGAACFSDVLQRVGAWLDQLAATEHASEIVALTHPMVIRAAILHALGAPAVAFTRIQVPPLCRFELRRAAHGWHWWPAR
ncbi:histidine phosphatase family protein [Amantichitinum ursilacus]|uniref:Bifunctional RNase H/acid phosphatase n=1 Tax=Amantichitinum ursilacus TaxID=857265 RepID=A0A0N0GN46_9NEIS|nr:histidine phosphatase family protein [Amantichitinum ursilacus]KPC52494.1 bifunctional RNase H/acid phosphatase [Amantichitinum ursilacus]